MISKPIPPLTDEQEARIQAGIAADPDNPELSCVQLAALQPFGAAFPALAEAMKRSRGRPKLAAPKEAVTLRVSPETIARYKALAGKDWRARMSEALENENR